MDNVLEVTGVNKNYQNFSLENITFTVPEGCITGFIGINGAGKTTTIRTILGLATKSAGSIKLFGQDMDKNEQQLKDRIGIVLDGSCFYDDLTMAEMKGIVSKAYSKWNDKSFKEYMDRFSLDSKQKIATLSKGMRIRYAIALALSHEAEMLIMDEPTNGLDPLARSQLLDIMSEFMKQGGKGVLFSTHITSDLDKIADTLVLIHDGKIMFERDKDELLESCRVVKGDTSNLNKSNTEYFLGLQTTAYGFSGLTDRCLEVQSSIPDALFERASIEDIMLAHIGKEDRTDAD